MGVKADADKSRTCDYIAANLIPREIELALSGLFKDMPEVPLVWLAQYFYARCQDLQLPCSLPGSPATASASSASSSHESPAQHPPSPTAPCSLYERMGGVMAVTRVIDMFFLRIENDVRVAFVLNDTNIDIVKKTMVTMLSAEIGSLGLPQDTRLPTVGTKLPLPLSSVSTLASHLRACMNDLGYTPAEVGPFVTAFIQLYSPAKRSSSVTWVQPHEAPLPQERRVSKPEADVPKVEDVEEVVVKKTLFERLGGAPAVEATVDKFYEKVVNDDRVKSFFKTVDMRKQRQKQKSFLTYAFGGPNNYTSKNMRDGHRHMVRDQGLNDMHFDTIVELLAGTLKELDIPDSDIAQVGAIAESVRDDVLCKGEGLEKKEKTLFERLGGESAVEATVDRFYEKVVNDDRVKSFFKTVDMQKQRQKQKSFLTYAFGGPNNYTSKNMRDGHRHMVRDQGLNDMHFDRIVELLTLTLAELGVHQSDIAEVTKIAESVRDDVLCRDEGLERPLFERLGGAPAVEATVDKFYAKVIDDDRIKSFFTATDMRRQRRHQRTFLTFAFGGPNSYNGRNMRDAHRRIVLEKGLSDTHFDIVLQLLICTLKELGVGDHDVAAVTTIVESIRDDVLCRGEVHKKKKLFERIGGDEALDKAVRHFYTKVLADRSVAPFFDGVDMDKQRQKQKQFLAFVFGGPAAYSAKGMRDGHRHLVRDQGLNDSHFDTILRYLTEALKEMGVSEHDVAEVSRIAESVREDVLCKGEGIVYVGSPRDSLYERIGGAIAVDIAVDKFYARVLADDRIKSFFLNVNMRTQRQKQKSFLTYAFGGPNHYSAKNMRDGHRSMVRDQGLNDMHFDIIQNLLSDTLRDLGVTEDDVADVNRFTESMRDDVLCKGEHENIESLYVRMGGEVAMQAVTEEFYAKVMRDARIFRFFDRVDMTKQHHLQKEFLTWATGGPVKYDTQRLRDQHRHLVRDHGMNETHFDTFVELLAGTLQEQGVGDEDIANVADVLFSVRDDVLSTGEVAPRKLFERIGGHAAVEIAVVKFYHKILAEPTVAPFFKGIDMAVQHQKQKSFLSFAFGGPNIYTGTNMRDGHRRMVREMGLSDYHFDKVVSILCATLTDMDVHAADIAEVVAITESVRNDILCKGE